MPGFTGPVLSGKEAISPLRSPLLTIEEGVRPCRSPVPYGEEHDPRLSGRSLGREASDQSFSAACPQR